MFEEKCKTCQYRASVGNPKEYLCTKLFEYKDGVLGIRDCNEETCCWANEEN